MMMSVDHMPAALTTPSAPTTEAATMSTPPRPRPTRLRAGPRQGSEVQEQRRHVKSREQQKRGTRRRNEELKREVELRVRERFRRR
jgi:hypothetical protein